jgi:small subunit ribosomal protein S6
LSARQRNFEGRNVQTSDLPVHYHKALGCIQWLQKVAPKSIPKNPICISRLGCVTFSPSHRLDGCAYTSLRTRSGAFVQEDPCMELYESLFIIRPSVSDEETNALIEKMKGVAERTGAQFIKSENWGRKKLAYEVRRERKGTYVYFYFKAPNNTVGELEHAYRLEDNIIKFLTVHLEKELVPRRVEAPSEEFTGGRV